MENVAFNGRNQRSSVPAVERAARLLRAIAAAKSAPRLSDLVRDTGLGKSTVHAVIHALHDVGFVEAVPTGGWRLGPELTALTAQGSVPSVLALGTVEVERLARETGETSMFGRVVGNDVVVDVARVPDRALNLSVHPGVSIPLHAGALGPACRIALQMSEATTSTAGENVTAAGGEMRVGGTKGRESQGYAIERNQYVDGVAAAAAACFCRGNVYIFWVLGIEQTLNDADLHRAGEAARAAADRLAAGLTLYNPLTRREQNENPVHTRRQ